MWEKLTLHSGGTHTLVQVHAHTTFGFTHTLLKAYSNITPGLLTLYFMFSHALLWVYSCFTSGLLILCGVFTHTLLRMYSQHTPSLLTLYFGFTRTLLCLLLTQDIHTCQSNPMHKCKLTQEGQCPPSLWWPPLLMEPRVQLASQAAHPPLTVSISQDL